MENLSGKFLALLIFGALLLVVLTASLVWVAKDIVDPCPDVTCPEGIKLRADVHGKRGDLVLEDCKATTFFKRAPYEAEEDGEDESPLGKW